ncbi:MAG TPA: sulfur oxidation c-type cytochrome SoxA [Burkholderiales bacterium]|nr:sulfur oxidation c-type cytochrome SoxA [Burkholderiales bacterium]
MRFPRLAAFLLAASVPCVCAAQQDTQKEVERYRQLLAEGNPADLFEAKGEELWKTPRGPKNASLEQCDLGLGAGVVKGAFARLPRYFPDTDRVQDLESRIVTCMVTLQGFKPEEAMKNPFSAPGRPSAMEALASYVAGASKGMKLAAPLSHPKEIEAFRIGEELFYRRAGPHDFACVSCHGDNGKRIRLQELPKLTDPHDARRIFTTWPAYRVSQGTVRTMQHRLYDCYWQMRHPQLDYASEASIALEVFMAKYANGGDIEAPGLKR